MSEPFTYSGTLSSGTLRDADLIPAFVDQLELMGADVSDFQPRAVAALTINPDGEEAGELVTELIDALDSLAPEGYRFGAHEGDGADFGFWEVDAD